MYRGILHHNVQKVDNIKCSFFPSFPLLGILMPCFFVESNIFIYRCPATVKQGREVCDAEFITGIIWIELIKLGGEAIGGEFWPADSLPFLSGIFHAGFHALGNDIPFHLGKDTPHH